jgi:hypothetical protein
MLVTSGLNCLRFDAVTSLEVAGRWKQAIGANDPACCSAIRRTRERRQVDDDRREIGTGFAIQISHGFVREFHWLFRFKTQCSRSLGRLPKRWFWAFERLAKVIGFSKQSTLLTPQRDARTLVMDGDDCVGQGTHDSVGYSLLGRVPDGL